MTPGVVVPPAESTPLVAVNSTAIPGISDGNDGLLPASVVENALVSTDGTDVVLVTTDAAAANGPVFRDVTFTLLFFIHAAIALYLGIIVAPKGYMGFDDIDMGDASGKWMKDVENGWNSNSDNSDWNITKEDIEQLEEFLTDAVQYSKVYPFRILVFMMFPCGIISYVVAFVTTAYIIRPFSRIVVVSSLCMPCVVVVAVLVWVLAFATPSVPVVVLLCVVLLCQVLAMKHLWKTIPFAAVNLSVSLEGISSNCGIYCVAFFSGDLGFVYVLCWIFTFIGVMNFQDQQCQQHAQQLLNDDCGGQGTNNEDGLDYDCPVQGPTFLFLLLSLYWTTTVIANFVHVTTAGVMATWCFDKTDAECCCSPAVCGSVFRSTTFAFGSICFGSLLQAVVGILRYLVEKAKQNREENNDGACALLDCLCSCLCRCFEETLDYFNQWAYVFVGIYGHSYLDSGRMAYDLFRARGWTSMMTDRLVHYALRFTTLLIAVIMGFVAIGLDVVVSNYFNEEESMVSSYAYGPIPQPKYFAFATGFVIAIPICSVMMNVVEGAVNTLIVCWADSPARLEANHPRATDEMAHAWNEVFPDAGVTTTALPPFGSGGAAPRIY